MGEIILPGPNLNMGENTPFVHPSDLFPSTHFPKIRSFKRREVIYHEGDVASTFFVVQSGIAKEMLRDTTGREYITALATPGNPVILGLEGLDGGRHATTAASVNGVTVQYIPKKDVEAIMQTNPDYTLALARHITHATRSRDARLASLTFLNFQARLAIGLLEAADALSDYARNTEDLPEFSQLTQSDLAAFIGSTRPSITTLLGYWERKGYVQREKSRIIVRNVDAIRRIGRNEVVLNIVPEGIQSQQLPEEMAQAIFA